MPDLHLDLTVHLSGDFHKNHLLWVIPLQQGMFRFQQKQPIV
jgi:hypothetical protein